MSASQRDWDVALDPGLFDASASAIAALMAAVGQAMMRCWRGVDCSVEEAGFRRVRAP